MGNFTNFFLHSSVTENHVQQYGEVNQLGGVFVNVSLMHLMTSSLADFKIAFYFYATGSSVAKWHENENSRVGSFRHSSV